MKKFLVILSALAFVLLGLGSCKGRSIYAMERDSEIEAMDERYREGISEAQEHIASLVEVEVSDLEFDIEDEYGVFPEEAIQILANYADDHKAINEEDLHIAIWAISEYYYDSLDIIYGIDNYWID